MLSPPFNGFCKFGTAFDIAPARGSHRRIHARPLPCGVVAVVPFSKAAIQLSRCGEEMLPQVVGIGEVDFLAFAQEKVSPHVVGIEEACFFGFS